MIGGLDYWYVCARGVDGGGRDCCFTDVGVAHRCVFGVRRCERYRDSWVFGDD